VEPTLADVLAGAIKTETGCPLFAGSISSGYGLIRRMSGGKTTRWLAHRVAYQHGVGEIPAGHEIHHRCQNRRCVNPAHLEAVTRRTHLGKGGRHVLAHGPDGRFISLEHGGYWGCLH
jgi:hypothetical protein